MFLHMLKTSMSISTEAAENNNEPTTADSDLFLRGSGGILMDPPEGTSPWDKSLKSSFSHHLLAESQTEVGGQRPTMAS